MSKAFVMAATGGCVIVLFVVARFWANRFGEPLTVRDPVAWFIAGTSIVAAGWAHFPAAAIVLATCVVCAATDVQTGYIFDVVLASAGVGLCVCTALFGGLASVALGAGICGGALWLLHVATRGRGLGFGDVKLSALIGGGLGYHSGAVAVGAAFVVGAMISIFALLTGRQARGDAIRFGPYLAIGTIVSVALTDRW